MLHAKVMPPGRRKAVFGGEGPPLLLSENSSQPGQPRLGRTLLAGFSPAQDPSELYGEIAITANSKKSISQPLLDRQ